MSTTNPIESQSVSEAFCSIQDILKSSNISPPILSEALKKLDFLSSSFSALFSVKLKEAVEESIDEKERKKIVVLDGLPESDSESGQQRNLDDLAMVRNISDNIGLDNTIWATERLGMRKSDRPRLLKIFFLSSKAASLFLKGFHHLRRSNQAFSKIYARYSLSDAERKRDFELRQEARKRSTEDVKFVVYAGVVVKKDDIPKIKNKLNTDTHNSQANRSAAKSQSSRNSRSQSARGTKRNSTPTNTNGTRPKQSIITKSPVSAEDLKIALAAKKHNDWLKEKDTSAAKSSETTSSH